jgi:hypothetical protein
VIGLGAPKQRSPRQGNLHFVSCFGVFMVHTFALYKSIALHDELRHLTAVILLTSYGRAMIYILRKLTFNFEKSHGKSLT